MLLLIFYLWAWAIILGLLNVKVIEISDKNCLKQSPFKEVLHGRKKGIKKCLGLQINFPKKRHDKDHLFLLLKERKYEL